MRDGIIIMRTVEVAAAANTGNRHKRRQAGQWRVWEWMMQGGVLMLLLLLVLNDNLVDYVAIAVTHMRHIVARSLVAVDVALMLDLHAA